MSKETGLAHNFYVGEFNISGDVGSLGAISCPQATLESTGIDKYAMERLPGKRDGHLEFTTFFNDAAGQAHPALKTLPRTDRIMSYFCGTTLGRPVFSMTAKQIGYDPNRADDGSLTMAVTAEANSFGAEWGRSLTAGVRTDTAATDGASLDGLASTAFGLQAYVHVFAFTGTDATITVEDSADDLTFAPVTGGAFTQVTGVTSERIQTARNLSVARYLRVSTSTTGGFTNLAFAVNVVRNQAEVLY